MKRSKAWAIREGWVRREFDRDGDWIWVSRKDQEKFKLGNFIEEESKMLNEMDKMYAKEIPVEALPALNHIFGNKVQTLGMRIDILQDTLDKVYSGENEELYGWKISSSIRHQIINTIEGYNQYTLSVKEFLEEVKKEGALK